MVTAIQYICETLVSPTGRLAILGASLMVIYTNFLDIMGRINYLITQLDSLSVPSTATGTALSLNVFGLINYVIPLDLVVAMLVLYLPYLLLCSGLRFIKGFIPTMN